MSDQQASTFTNPLYAPLKLKVARYIAPYDVTSEPAEKRKLDSWIHNAKIAKQTMLISFEHSRTQAKYNKAPSRRDLHEGAEGVQEEVRPKFDITPWNEVNVCQAPGRMEGQPAKICKSATGPKLVAQYYSAAKSVFAGRKIIAIDILDGFNVGGAVSYLRKFKKYVKGTPKYWGIHNYSDTNRGSTSRTSRLIKEISNKKAEIWLTETGGQLKLRGVVRRCSEQGRQRAEVHVLDAQEVQADQALVHLPVQRRGLVQRLRRRPDQPRQHDARGLRRGQEAQVGHLPRLGSARFPAAVATGALGAPVARSGCGRAGS